MQNPSRSQWSLLKNPTGKYIFKSVTQAACEYHCPVAGIMERDDTNKVLDILQDPDYHTVVQIAPAVRVALGEEFGMEPGTIVTGKIYHALRILGFDKIFDTNFGADLTIMEEAAEFAECFIHEPEKLPLITTCCPSWINWCEKFYPAMIDNISSSKSPQQMLGTMVKTYYAEREKLDKSKIKMISIMPCVSKKVELHRHPDKLFSSLYVRKWYTDGYHNFPELEVTASNFCSINKFK